MDVIELYWSWTGVRGGGRGRSRNFSTGRVFPDPVKLAASLFGYGRPLLAPLAFRLLGLPFKACRTGHWGAWWAFISPVGARGIASGIAVVTILGGARDGSAFVRLWCVSEWWGRG